ncbi:MAG TPA: carboxypeptidase-like regulatory domain-containing protein, partial [Terriglobales bacterium]|nr:carboxypeptidase-like regulatory domain-containing protein [Terriglobales bacterium]
MMRARVVGCSLLCMLLVLLSLPALSQVVSVTVQGRVYDSTGAVIPDAQVTAVNTATSISRTATTDANGGYQIALLPVGDYVVTVNKQGFQKQVKKVHLDVGQVGAVNFT